MAGPPEIQAYKFQGITSRNILFFLRSINSDIHRNLLFSILPDIGITCKICPPKFCITTILVELSNIRFAFETFFQPCRTKYISLCINPLL